MNSIPVVHFCADANSGLGHVMRSKALQGAWRSMFSANITCNAPGFPDDPSVVVFDDYNVNDEQRAFWMSFGHMVVSYTEFNVEQNADIIVNQNIGASASGGKKNLLGPRYFALREEYFNLRINESGGVFDADAEKRNLSPVEFSQKMALASHVVTAAGLAAYEALYLGKQLLLRKIADNQELTYTNLIAKGYAEPATEGNIGRAVLGDRFTLRDGRFLVDGLGAGRVCREIMNLWRNLHG